MLSFATVPRLGYSLTKSGFDLPDPNDQLTASNYIKKLLGGSSLAHSTLIERWQDLIKAVEAFWKLIPKNSHPPKELFEKPLWTTWAIFKNNINQENVIDYANSIKEHGFTCSVFGIDAKWQKEFGDLEFDPSRFPDPKSLIKEIKKLDCEVTCWTIPFYATTSTIFKTAVNNDCVLLNRVDGKPYIGKWWEGEAAFLDLTSSSACDWHFNLLKNLAYSGQNNSTQTMGQVIKLEQR